MSREFVKGCAATAPNGNQWRRFVEDCGSLERSWEPITEDLSNSLCDADIHLFGLTVTWPEPEPSVVEATVMCESTLRQPYFVMGLPKSWRDTDVLVIRKDRVVHDFQHRPADVSTPYMDFIHSFNWGGNYRVIVLEAE